MKPYMLDSHFALCIIDPTSEKLRFEGKGLRKMSFFFKGYKLVIEIIFVK